VGELLPSSFEAVSFRALYGIGLDTSKYKGMSVYIDADADSKTGVVIKSGTGACNWGTAFFMPCVAGQVLVLQGILVSW
jgi:hypothetical protein